MMNRRLAYAHAWIVATECVSILEGVLACPVPLNKHHSALNLALRKLAGFVHTSLNLGLPDRFACFVIPLADAFSSLSDATQGVHFKRDGILVAVALLKQAVAAESGKGGNNHVASNN